MRFRYLGQRTSRAEAAALLAAHTTAHVALIATHAAHATLRDKP